MKKLIKRIILILIIIFIISIFLEDDEEIIENTGTDKYTVMVYMCGSDLESDDAYASDDIEEMLNSQLADEVNLLIYTGGTKDWYNDKISDTKNQIFKVENKELVLLKEDVQKGYMSDPDALEYFIDYSKRHYEADKYALIMWDHGGGSVSGFGYDENNPDEEDTLTLKEIKQALRNVDDKLEFIGFDACLMSNFELAYTIKDKVKYLIASEELEPGSGWDYKKLFNQLSKNTSQDTVELGTYIIDNYIQSNDSFFFGSDATLSIIDLSKMDNLYNNVETYLKEIRNEKFNSNKYTQVSKALQKTKSFADGEIDTIDIKDLAFNLENSYSEKLIQALDDTIIYNKTTSLVENTNGLSIYFPNENLEYYEDMIDTYYAIGFTNDYINIMNEYVNIIAGGYRNTYRINNHTYEKEENYEEYNWYDYNLIDEYDDYYTETDIDVEELEVQEKNEGYVLHLKEEEWEKIKDIGYSIWYDDGEGYIDLGINTNYNFDEDDDLVINFDGSWVAINDNIVNYQVVEQTEKYEKGKVHALLNDEEVNLIIYWNKKKNKVEVVGAEPIDEYGQTAMYGKGYIKIKENDKIEFIVDYYDYDGNYDDEYILGDPLIVGKDGLKVTYEYIGDGECLIYFILEDIFNNQYYTEPVILY